MRILSIILFVFPFILSCQSNARVSSKERGYVDDIIQDTHIDDPAFKPCNESYIFQYFNDGKGLLYQGEKPVLLTAFKQQYNSELVPKESGLIRIRFVVNCEGRSGRYRVIGMNGNYEPKNFSKQITDQLLAIIKTLDGWGIQHYKGKAVDYYQYLIFKLKEGQITHILP